MNLMVLIRRRTRSLPRYLLYNLKMRRTVSVFLPMSRGMTVGLHGVGLFWVVTLKVAVTSSKS